MPTLVLLEELEPNGLYHALRSLTNLYHHILLATFVVLTIMTVSIHENSKAVFTPVPVRVPVPFHPFV